MLIRALREDIWAIAIGWGPLGVDPEDALMGCFDQEKAQLAIQTNRSKVQYAGLPWGGGAEWIGGSPIPSGADAHAFAKPILEHLPRVPHQFRPGDELFGV